MLLGYRDRCEDGSGEEHIRVSRDIAVPAGAAAGNLTFNFQVQGWDGISNATNYDWVIVSVNGTAVNHTALGISNTTTPQLVIEAGRFGRNAYNTTYLDHGWKQATLNLSAYAGTHDQLPRRNPPHLFGRRLSLVGEVTATTSVASSTAVPGGSTTSAPSSPRSTCSWESWWAWYQ